jgi:hypothetical protein
VHHIDPDRGRAFEPTVATIPFILTRPETHHPEATPWPAGERAASGHETSV